MNKYVKSPSISLFALRGGYYKGMRVTSTGLRYLKELVAFIEEDLNVAESKNRTGESAKAGYLFFAPLTEQAKAKFGNNPPDAMVNYKTYAEIEDFRGSPKKDEDVGF